MINRLHHPKHPKRRVFFSFHYEADAWRAAQIRNAGVLDGNEPVSDNSWEQVKRGGDAAIKRWIDEQIASRSCVVVLIGTNTADRKWVKYEIKRGWDTGKGVVGVFVHNLLDENRKKSIKGKNPFKAFKIGCTPMDQVVRAYDPPFSNSRAVYDHVTNNIADWVEEAIEIRSRWG